MPPPVSHKKLTPQQKELLKRWIAEGAAYQGHWSYCAARESRTFPPASTEWTTWCKSDWPRRG